MKFEELERELNKFQKKLKERTKVEEKVFDKATLLTLYELANKGYIDLLFGTIKSGKESCVFLGKKGEKSLAVKIHKVYASDFKNMIRYLEGDYRFRRLRKSRREIVYMWVQKEFKNLKLAEKANVKAPRAIAYKNNVVVMEFIGKNSAPAPMLKYCKLEEDDKKRIYKIILSYVKDLYSKARLVHADLSEYNILMHEGEPVIIDFSQAVPLTHPLAMQFLERDVKNICRFFNEDYKKAIKSVLKWST